MCIKGTKLQSSRHEKNLQEFLHKTVGFIKRLELFYELYQECVKIPKKISFQPEGTSSKCSIDIAVPN
jgi:hypothetical protein